MTSIRTVTCSDTNAGANGTVAADSEFRELTEPYRRELQVHCYRMLGSLHDAEDALQETLLAAWRGIEGFEGRASVRSWLYRIATNRCLNARRDRGRRPLDALPTPPFEPPQPTRWSELPWVEPYPDALLEGLADSLPGPEARYEAREAMELAFITLLQLLPPRQRAVLVLKDVLGFTTEEVAGLLETSVLSAKGALQRARATVARHGAQHSPGAGSDEERRLARGFAAAFEADDVEGLIALLTDDAVLAMPPYPHEYHGPRQIADFLRASAGWRAGRHYRLEPTRANMQPAFGCWLAERGEPAGPAGLVVLTLEGTHIARVTRFMDPTLFRRFGLPETLG